MTEESTDTQTSALDLARKKLSADPSTDIIQLNPSKWGWWTCRELAKELGVSVNSVQRDAQKGRIVARKPAWLGCWLIPAVEVQRLLEQDNQTNA